MGQDFTSLSYPMHSGISGSEGNENHLEPASEGIRSSVVDAEHPLFGLAESVLSLNFRRSVSNSLEPAISGNTSQQTITDMVKAAYSKKFPVEMLMYAADWTKDFPSRDGMSDASDIIGKLTSYSNDLTSSLGRNPKNFEIFMAHAVESSSKAKELLDKAEQKPYEKAEPIGSKKDDVIFYKKKFDEKVKRTNKEVVQFFMKRMLTGTDFFPHLPLGSDKTG